MPERFPDSVVEAAWRRAGGRCECTRTTHGHVGRCNAQLHKAKRGQEGPGGWEAHHIVAGGPAVLSNCEVLCTECHKKTKTYGR